MAEPTIRDQAHAELAKLAAKIFVAHPEARSVMCGFAQYWADEADDAVHSHLVASNREVPLWPHPCDADDGVYSDDFVPMPGEYCDACAKSFPYLGIDNNDEATISAFAAYCTENGSQESSAGENYTPYAIAHRRDGYVEIEVVGAQLRSQGVPAIGDGHPDIAPWPDTRAEALFGQICTHPNEDGPRHVLADHLLERDDPRGELITLELAAVRDAASHARRTALLETHLAEWIAPLGAVIAQGGARTSRGFLSHVDVYTDDAAAIDRVRGSAMWGTVASLRYLHDSASLLDPAMISLRTVGVIDDDGDIDTLVTAPRPWAIETLAIDRLDMASAARLGSARTLPALRHLILHDEPGVIAVLGSASWWSQLAKLTILGDESQAILDLPAVRALPTVAFGPEGTLGEPTGWHATHVRDADRVEIALAGWTGKGSLAELARVIARARTRATTVTLVASRFFVPTDADRARVGL